MRTTGAIYLIEVDVEDDPHIDIHNEMRQKIDNYISETGTEPEGILLGPNEYQSFLFWASERGVEPQLYERITFNNYPVYSKRAPGVDVVIPGHMSRRFTIKLLKS